MTSDQQQLFMQLNNQIWVYKFTVGGHHALLQLGKFVLKPFDEIEYLFYKKISACEPNTPQHYFLEHIPEYFGLMQFQSAKGLNQQQSSIQSVQLKSKYIKLQNLTSLLREPCVLDVKLGIRSKMRQSHYEKIKQSITFTHYFRLCGMRTYCPILHKTFCQDKYKHRNDCIDQVYQRLAFFFWDGARLREQLIKEVISKIIQIIESMKRLTNHQFQSVSLLIVYDGLQSTTDGLKCKIIDFGGYRINEAIEYDNNCVKGLTNLINSLQTVLVSKNLIDSCKNQQQESTEIAK